MAPDSRSETYGIAEWYGRLFVDLTPEERQQLAEMQTLRKADQPVMPCPFQTDGDETVPCTKAGGVCSLRKYVETAEGAEPASGTEGRICATCPYRFEEDALIYQWIGRELLGSPDPIVLGEVGFLEDAEGKKVGRIDGILVHPEIDPLQWCALEKQGADGQTSAAADPNVSCRNCRSRSQRFAAGDERWRSSWINRSSPRWVGWRRLSTCRMVTSSGLSSGTKSKRGG